MGVPTRECARFLEALGEAAAVVAGDGTLVHLTRGARAMLRRAGARGRLGNAFTTLFRPRERARVREALRSAVARSRGRVEARLGGARPLSLSLSLVPVTIAREDAAVVFLRDERARTDLLERKAREVEALAEILIAVSEARSVRSICRVACERVARILGPKVGVTIFLEDPPERIHCVAAAGLAQLERIQAAFDGPAPPHYRQARETGQPVIVRDMRADPEARPFLRKARRQGVSAYAIVPLGSRGRVRGMLAIGMPSGDRIDDEAVRIMGDIGRSVGIAIEKAELIEALGKQVEDTELLRDVSAEVTGSLALEPLLARVARGLARLIDVPQAFILLYSEEEDALVGVASTEPVRLMRRTVYIPVKGVRSLAVEAWRTKQPIAVEDARTDPRTNKRLVKLFAEQSLLAIPMLVSDEAIGAVMLGETRYRRQFRPDEIARVQTVANHAALAIANARRHEEAVRMRERAELLLEVVRSSTSSMNLCESLGRMAEQLARLTAAGQAAILLPDEAEERILEVVHVGGGPGVHEAAMRLVGRRIDSIPAGPHVRQAHGAVVIDDVVAQGMLSRRLARSLELRGLVLAPVRAGGRLVAAIAVAYAPDTERISADQVAIVEAVARQIALAIANARAFNEIARQQRSLDMLSTRIIGAQEDERRRIARELHDGVSQSLTAVKLTLERIARGGRTAAGPGAGGTSELDRGIAQLGDAIREIRRLCMDLRPSQLDHLGFGATVCWYARSFAERSGIDTRVDVADELPPLTPEIEINLYRIMQEALSNVAKHARAKRVEVRVARDDGRIRISVEDDGIGFDPAAVERRQEGERGFGLLTMGERAHLLRGELEVRSREGQGTQIAVSVPVPPAAEAAMTRRLPARAAPPEMR